jgi:AAA domain
VSAPDIALPDDLGHDVSWPDDPIPPSLTEAERAAHERRQERELREPAVRAEPPPEDPDWLQRASDLLEEPDPGPTPFLVEDLIVDQAIAAAVGSYKVAKSYTLTELAIAIVTGRDAFGAYSVPDPGPVVMVMEESGRAAFHRRLDMLRRGYALQSGQLAELYFAANLGVRLNEPEWQDRLLLAGAALRPRAIILDPLVRLKGATVNENEQSEMGPVLDFMRRLRDESGAAIPYSHHTGHQGSHQRGSSDLEGYWESRLQIDKEPDGARKVTADHREAESGHSFRFRLDFDEQSRSLRMRTVRSDLEQAVEAYLREHPTATKNEVKENVEGRRADVLRLVDEVRERLSEQARMEGL